MLCRFLVTDNGKIRITVPAVPEEVAHAVCGCYQNLQYASSGSVGGFVYDHIRSEVGRAKHARAAQRCSEGQALSAARPNGLKELSSTSLTSWLKTPVTSPHER